MANDEHRPDAPPPTPGLWPDQDSGPWHIQLYWGNVKGRIECVGFEIKSVPSPYELPGRSHAAGWTPEPRVLTSSVLRDLNLTTIVEASKLGKARYYELWSQLDEGKREGLLKAAAELKASMRSSKKGGRPSLPPEHYAKVAGVYMSAWENGLKPTEAVKNYFVVSKSTAAKWVSRARQLEFLGPTTRGKAGGVHVDDREDK